jgi:putative SOS response-associated peptidase YedK
LWEGDTAALITTDANDAVRPVHIRMPVIVPADQLDAWLDPATDRDALDPLLSDPVPNRELTARPVSTVVNNARLDGPECVAPA